VPRLINILCDRALLGAFVQGKRQVGCATLVQAAREVAGDSPSPKWRIAAVAALVVCLSVAVLLALPGRRLPERAPSPPPAPAPTAPVAVASVPAVTIPASSALNTGGAGNHPAKTTSSPHPLSPVSGELRSLMEQPEAQKQDEAWAGLYRLWGIRVGAGGNGCAQALVRGLDCLRGEGGLEQLRRLNRPAIVRVYDSQGAPRWLVLERLQGRQATLAAGRVRAVVDIDKLAGYDISEFVLFWRPPVHTEGALAAGDHGAGVAWLVKRLGPAGGAISAATSDPVFDETLTDAVRRFQRAVGIADDGVAGPETLILLDVEPAPGTPTLTGAS